MGQATPRFAPRKICIDPGHGMSGLGWGIEDTGQMVEEDGILYREADIVLAFGQALREAFHARGTPAMLTREDAGDHAPNNRRVTAAEALGCEMVLSLHVNCLTRSETGIGVMYRSAPDRALAQRLSHAVAEAAGLAERGVWQGARDAAPQFHGPMALIELGSLADDTDRAALLSPLLRRRICEAIAEAVLGSKVIGRRAGGRRT